MTRYCCDRMRDDLERACPSHVDRSDCPDALVARGRRGGYGLWVHDGGSSLVTIAYCPWCGTRLERGRWRSALRKRPIVPWRVRHRQP